MPSGASLTVVVVLPPGTVVAPGTVVLVPGTVVPPAPVVVVSPPGVSGAVTSGWNGSRGWPSSTEGLSPPPVGPATAPPPATVGADGNAPSAPLNTPADAISHTEAPAVATSTNETRTESRVRLAPIMSPFLP